MQTHFCFLMGYNKSGRLTQFIKRDEIWAPFTRLQMIYLCLLCVTHESSDAKLLHTRPLCCKDVVGSVRSCTPACGLFTDGIFMIHVSASLAYPTGDYPSPPGGLWAPEWPHFGLALAPTGSIGLLAAVIVMFVAWLLTTDKGLFALFCFRKVLFILISFPLYRKMTRIVQTLIHLFALLSYSLSLSLPFYSKLMPCPFTPLNTPVSIFQKLLQGGDCTLLLN